MGNGTTEVVWMIMASAVLRQLCYLVLDSPEDKNMRIFYPLNIAQYKIMSIFVSIIFKRKVRL